MDAGAGYVPEATPTEAIDGSGEGAASVVDSGNAGAPLPYHGGIGALMLVNADGGVTYSYSASFATAAQYLPPGAFSPCASSSRGRVVSSRSRSSSKRG